MVQGRLPKLYKRKALYVELLLLIFSFGSVSKADAERVNVSLMKNENVTMVKSGSAEKGRIKGALKQKSGKRKVSLKSVKIINGCVLRVKLDRAASLKKKDVTVKVKSSAKGKYQKKVSVSRVEKLNKKTYDVILSEKAYDYMDGDYALSSGDYVLVKIGKLSGTKKRETFYGTLEKTYISYQTGMVGKEFYAGINFEEYVTGYCKYKITGLPKGLKAVKKKDYVVIKGTPKKTQTGKAIIITATDETGKKVARKLYPVIGSSSKIVTMQDKENTKVLFGDGNEERCYFFIAGGSGLYQINVKTGKSVVSDIENPAYDEEEENGVRQFVVSDQLLAGKYQITYEVQDLKKLSLKTTGTAKFTAEKPVKIAGKVLAKDGRGVPQANVEYSFTDQNHEYAVSRFLTRTDENGDYICYVAASQIYESHAEAAYTEKGEPYFMVGKKGVKKNFSLPLYRVILLSREGEDLSGLLWEDEYALDEPYKGTEFLLPKGEYTFTSDNVWVEYSVSFTVTDRNLSVYVTRKDLVTGVLNIPGTTKEVTIAGEEDEYASIYKLTPPKDGRYMISIDHIGEAAIIVILKESDPDTPVFGSSIEDWTFEKSANMLLSLKAGENYYIYTYSLSERKAVTTDISIEEIEESA